MRSTLFSLVLLAAPMALFSGCVDSPDTTDVDDEEAPEYRVMGGGTGSQGHNGLDFAPYALFDTALGQAMKLPLVVPGTDTVSPEVANLLLVPYAGRATFEYAMYCALPEKMTVYWNGLKYEGLGHVAKADKWLQGPLPEPVQDDVYACMAAHVNSIDDINILLQGAHVNPDEATHEDFDVVEAIWYAKQNVDDVPLYVGIPLEPLQKKCGGDPAIALAHPLLRAEPPGLRAQGGQHRQLRARQGGSGHLDLRGHPGDPDEAPPQGLRDLLQLLPVKTRLRPSPGAGCE